MTAAGRELLKKWRENEQPPDAIDDAGHACEQFDGGADGALERPRAKLGEEYRDADTERHGDHHRQRGADDRAVDRRERAELFGDRIPVVRSEEVPAERFERQPRARDQRDHDADEDRDHDQRGAERHHTKARVAAAEPAQRCASRRRGEVFCQSDIGHLEMPVIFLKELGAAPAPNSSPHFYQRLRELPLLRCLRASSP